MENVKNLGTDALRLPRVPTFTVIVCEKFLIKIRKGVIKL